jgi:hypothetical protein
MILKHFSKFFDRFEDRLRIHLSRTPITYSIIGGVFVVLFWRSVWHTADLLEFRGGWWELLLSGPVSFLIATGVLLATGLMVSTFIGDRIILSGLKKEKKFVDMTEAELMLETNMLNSLDKRVSELQKEIAEIKQAVNRGK